MMIIAILVTLIATGAVLYGYSIIKSNASLVSGSSMRTRPVTSRRAKTETDDIAAAYLKTLAR